ncbi:hypothetical protein [Paenibacillus sp. SN-8-1]|uniref:hypothetical protein n=1 Tax=Paenibacillus sp. SN-8-1 TaxID=3435409 RepID=UPI003D9A62AF
MTISPATNHQQAFNELKNQVKDPPPHELIVLQDARELGDSSGYTYVTLTLTVRNTDYITMKNLYLDLEPVAANKDQIILYFRDPQYIEIPPFQASSVALTALVKTNNSSNNEINRILNHSHVHIKWGSDNNTTIDLPWSS